MPDPRKMPYGKLPALRVADRIIADSDNIRAYLEQQGHDFDAGLSKTDRATSRAFIRMAEEHMYFHQVMDRWAVDANWEKVRVELFNVIPRMVRGIVARKLRKNLLRSMHGQGIGRFNAQERLARIEPDFQAIAAHLQDGGFLFGAHPTAADASVAAVLGGIAASPTPTPLSQRVQKDAVLSAYVARCKQVMGA